MDKIILKFFKSFSGKKLTSKDLKLAVKKAMNLGATAEDLLLIINLIKDTKNKKYKLDKKCFFILTTAIVYVIAPIDAVSDLIPVAGWVDDATLIGYVARSYADVLRDYKEFTRVNISNDKKEHTE
ncbi:MAG: YkvA family protein [Cetobacterium sp.]|uniref:YkvA family protein n=1 Tax=unclassified Cetobacterium TaxID=2630983 RepID=UPI0006491794|nr:MULTISPECIES: YkvA family protein [unclassified Cetobacterium]